MHSICLISSILLQLSNPHKIAFLLPMFQIEHYFNDFNDCNNYYYNYYNDQDYFLFFHWFIHQYLLISANSHSNHPSLRSIAIGNTAKQRVLLQPYTYQKSHCKNKPTDSFHIFWEQSPATYLISSTLTRFPRLIAPNAPYNPAVPTPQ